ncbi:gamma-glutamylcyclotransferase family protein [Caulobacter sp. S45]|uniref:gamma-glutamylcyclotransferase family protein n=1 Tax=Caulobacter sp. S45 TaxID=1641861 RepID=UPI00131D9C68|nr:gamma-glutamylcyclotransferase family protein [Caulobacter sp. S45]
MSDARVIALFSYGTLQLESVQVASFGRRLGGEPDAMVKFRMEMIEITDPNVLAVSGMRFHPIVLPSDDPADVVKGTVFRITPEELDAADRYEVVDYTRVYLRLRSGLDAWVYIRHKQPSD